MVTSALAGASYLAWALARALVTHTPLGGHHVSKPSALNLTQVNFYHVCKSRAYLLISFLPAFYWWAAPQRQAHQTYISLTAMDEEILLAGDLVSFAIQPPARVTGLLGPNIETQNLNKALRRSKNPPLGGMGPPWGASLLLSLLERRPSLYTRALKWALWEIDF